MKKTLKLFGLAALAAIAFSCTKKDDPFTPGTPTDQTTPTEGQTDEPAVIPATDGGVLTSFGATVDSEATKVTVDLKVGTTAIEEGDEVLVVDKDGINSATYVYDGTKFVLGKDQTAVTVDNTGVYYPASKYKVVDGTVRLELPAGIAARDDDGYDFGAAFGDINPMAGVITGELGNYSVTLKNLTSVLRVNVRAGVNINSVTLDFGSGNYYAAGDKFTVGGLLTTTPTLTYVEGTKSTATVNVGAAKNADVLFLLPTVELTGGITVTANLAENHNGGTKSFSLSKAAYKPAVNKISTMSFYAGLFSGGTGTSGDPYKIANARDFKHISVYCANGYTPGGEDKDAASFLGAYYQQTANINFKGADLSEYMIGGASTPFTGNYNGKPESTQFTLSNFIISGTPSSALEGVAPFKAVDNAVLKNISISDARVSGGKFTAGLVGYAIGDDLTIENCSISNSTITGNPSGSNNHGAGGLIGGLYNGTVEGCSGTKLSFSSSTNKSYYGGLISYVGGTTDVKVKKCTLKGETTVTGANYFGGIVGQVNQDKALITECDNLSYINSTADFAAGICGYATKGTISNCTNKNLIEAVNDAGGIVARLNGATVTGCENTGNLTVTGSYAGGIVASFYSGMIEKSRSNAVVDVKNNYAGGLIGAMESKEAKVNSCFAKGNVKGATFVGGFIGSMQADASYIVNSLASANVVATAKENNQAAGGFVGYLKNKTNGQNAWIGNCAVYNVIVKAINQTSNTKPVRIGGFVGVHNKTTSAVNSKIQNCYYQGTAERLGYKGGDDFTTNPATTGGGYHGGIAGYSAATLLDCYSTPKVKANGSGGTYTNNITLTQNFIYGNTLSNPKITTSTLVTLDANTKTLGEVLSAVDDTFSGMVFSDWDCYEENGKYYYYPASLTDLGEEFYKK